ncbi:MAG TPA: alpha/beta fold hydrolase, partial [Thermoanaerobaculia bacterium]
VLSAKTAAALERATERLAEWLERRPELSREELADAAFTLQVGRKAFRHRRTLVCRNAGEAVALLRGGDPRRLWTHTTGAPVGITFLFPGQGAQRPGMGAGLYSEEPAYRAALDRCCELLAPELGFDLRSLLHAAPDDEDAAARLAETAVTQPALFAVEHALAQLWIGWGVRPVAMLGHSIGEYVAACVAGVFTLEEAVRLVAARGRLMQSLPPGAMLGVPLPEEEVAGLLAAHPELSLAAVNAPASCVVSGPREASAAFREELGRKGLDTRPLRTSHAFHSAMMEPALPAFREVVAGVALRAPEVPYLSNLTGAWITAEEATDPEYWVRHLRSTVRFADGLAALLGQPGRVLLEVGPGRTLATLANQHPQKGAAELIVATLGRPKDSAVELDAVLETAGRLWAAGLEIDWERFHGPGRRRRVPLPTYPFERKRHWVDWRPSGAAAAAPTSDDREPEAEPPAEVAAGFVPPRNPAEEGVAAAWAELLGVAQVGAFDDFFELGGSSLMAVQLGSRLRDDFGVQLPSNFLLETSTVADLAERIAAAQPAAGEAAAVPRSTCLVRLQPGDGRPPLFMVHQVGGNVYTFRALGKELGRGQPLYGLRSLGLEPGEEPLAAVEAMAEHYLALLRETQPRGPYRLGGASMGGMVAYEMAQRLAAASERVALLALMDTPCGEQMPARPDEAEFEVAAGVTGPDAEQARRLMGVLRGNVHALFDYRLQPWAGPMVYFRAATRRPIDPPRPELPWIELVQGGIEIHLVPGDHETMHEPPNVSAMAGVLRTKLTG